METGIQQKSRQARADIISHDGGALFLCNWVRFVLIHYEVEKEVLQSVVPFELDLFEGMAYVSLVAFTLEDFRFAHNGVVKRLMMRPVRTHRYFNVRTYIKYRDQKGIYFIKEWISNKLCSLIGSKLYGLPCEYGRLNYAHELPSGLVSGEVIPHDKNQNYQYCLRRNRVKFIDGVKAHTLEEFLFERYTAFVEKDGIKKYFRIWHEPWRLTEIGVEYINDRLMPSLGAWGAGLQPVKAHYSPGVYDVWMGKPLTLG